MNLQDVQNAAVKLSRAVEAGGVDPISGYSIEDIEEYLLSANDDDRVEAAAAAVLRRHGLLADV